DDTVLGWDISPDTLEEAQLEGCVDETLTDETLSTCDAVVVALYPEAAADYIESRANLFRPGAVVTDVCGLKRGICGRLEALAKTAAFTFVGAHPMAGRERGGFANSTADLFRGASLIVTPYAWQPEAAVEAVWAFYRRLGFGSLKRSTPQEHDQVIAYTSQLAHLMTAAYMIDPLAARHQGFSAGSFRDMTRVARVNEYLWSELFIENRDFLCAEADGLAARILELSRAARAGDRDTLIRLLRQSRLTKEAMLEEERKAESDLRKG
ncbi:MAG: prephenate dehydrogenase, partial [Clostridia bacterium]|nr:prephenate dehydrogenase [Clostridia bacterium]